jgi:hypothetical protein
MERIGGCAQGQKSQRAVDFIEVAVVLEKLGNVPSVSGFQASDSDEEIIPLLLLLLAIDLVVLRGNDLPLAVAL